LLKSTLLQLDSTFSERSYGASSFLDFAEKLAQAGLVQLKHAGRSVMVELANGFEDSDAQEVKGLKLGAATEGTREAGEGVAADATPQAAPVSNPARSEAEPPPQLGDNAEGAKVAGGILAAAAHARWPMYLRNAKQLLRAGGFDERRYGYSGLMDLLRACQREGTVRLERDRRGGLRVFQGSALARGITPAAQIEAVAASVVSTQADPTTALDDTVDTDAFEHAPVAVVDTTAELLGRAKPRLPRTRAAAGSAKATAPGISSTPRRAKRPIQRLATGARRPRSKKAPIEVAEEPSS
jgi:hypothetical protein